MAENDVFTLCETCGQPKIKDEQVKYLILMFESEKARQAFFEAVQEERQMTAYKY